MTFDERLRELTYEQRELFEALLRRERLAASAAATYREPGGATEAALVRIWSDLLGGTPGVDENYFELGGDSITIVRMVARARAEGIELRTEWVFSHPTIAALAAHARSPRPAAAPAIAIAPFASDGPGATIARVPRDGPLTLAPQQERWWLNASLTDAVHPNNVQFGLRFTGPLHVPALEQALAILHARHEALRTRFAAQDDGTAVPVIEPIEACPLPPRRFDLRALDRDRAEAVLRRVSRLEQDRPFDLTRDALCRTALLTLGVDEHVLLVTQHHLVSDGTSEDVLMIELAAACARVDRGQPADLPPLPAQYVDFARWQRDWIDTAGIEPSLAYWRRQLAPPLPLLLPDRPSDPRIDTACFSVRGRVPFTLAPPALAAARALARRCRCTPFCSVTAALSIVLYAHSGETDVRIGTLAANRGLPGTERIVGLLTNPICLRGRVDPAAPFEALARQLHGAIGDATAHQDLPFDLLVERLFDEHGTLPASLFQVIVFWRTLSPALVRLPGVRTDMYYRDDTDTVVMARNALELKWDLVEMPDRVSGSVTYRTTRFTDEDIRQWIAGLERCLLQAHDAPATTVAALRDGVAHRGARVRPRT